MVPQQKQVFLLLLRSHFMSFHYIFCPGYLQSLSTLTSPPPSPLPPSPPIFPFQERKVKILLYFPSNHSSRKRFILVSLPQVGCSLLLEGTKEQDCFQSPLVRRKTKCHSKLASTISINPVPCFTISKLVLSKDWQ